MKYDAREIQALYARGESVMAWMRARERAENNSATAILYAYDAQAGSYVALLRDPKQSALKAEIGRKLSPLIAECAPESLLEAGTGEATTLAPVLSALAHKPKDVLGFDLSLSRLLFARSHLASSGHGASLFTAALENIPLADASIDVVFTMHAVEPNRGREEEILRELLRVTAKRLILIEPSYELGSDATRQRMDRLGYVRGLPETLARLGYPPKLVERFGLDVNPQNEAALIVVNKHNARPGTSAFVSPLSRQPLVRRDDCLFCPEDGHAYPVVSGIPCLTTENAILASKLGDF